jgi:hypothetical protein
MRGLKTVLTVIGIVCFLSSVPAVAAPWSSVVRWLGILGLEAPPEHPAVVYMMRIGSLSFALIGIFFLVLASDPLRYRAMLVLAVCGCWAVAICALAAGWVVQMQPVWYVADVLGCALAGVLILAFWPRGVQAARAEAAA